LLVDASEQGICRPADDETQKKHYSGKAKRHTIKTQYTTSAGGLILHTSAPVAGSMHDFVRSSRWIRRRFRRTCPEMVVRGAGAPWIS
ncbi:MAG: hypothetical protein IS632_00770, partial [Thaumarchaeota archaeon]|nr:hypothetical protein [Nitrososphaerota archaeon]